MMRKSAEQQTFIVGVDLAGPANATDTAVACFCEEETGLRWIEGGLGYGDAELFVLVEALAGRGALALGLDAPLSYQCGGGDRPGDRALRRRLLDAGLAAGSVMTPTMTRMAYLTLRGLAVARGVGLVVPTARLAEVHPLGALVLRGAPLEAVRRLKGSASDRAAVVDWLGTQGVNDLPAGPVSDHEVAAYGCALAAWGWLAGQPLWCHAACPPLHPYDLVS